jgi:hypothetical protein
MDIDGDGDVERRTLGVETILTTFCSGTAINSFDTWQIKLQAVYSRHLKGTGACMDHT